MMRQWCAQDNKQTCSCTFASLQVFKQKWQQQQKNEKDKQASLLCNIAWHLKDPKQLWYKYAVI